MKYCKHCLQPDTRPNTRFTDADICPACDYFGRLQQVDWQERYEILEDLLARYPRKANQFDCIIGVSGGKDSTRQALWVRDKLGRKPLLACLSYPPQQVTQRGVDNISNLIEQGFDVVVLAPAPETWRQLMRESFSRFTNWARSTEMALFSSVPQLAIRYGIPLILWGENPGLQLGDLKTLGKTGYDGNNLRNMNTLSGGVMEWMREAGVAPGSLLPYEYPTPAEFDAHQLQIVYLGWFLGDWSLVNNGIVLLHQWPERARRHSGEHRRPAGYHLAGRGLGHAQPDDQVLQVRLRTGDGLCKRGNPGSAASRGRTPSTSSSATTTPARMSTSRAFATTSTSAWKTSGCRYAARSTASSSTWMRQAASRGASRSESGCEATDHRHRGLWRRQPGLGLACAARLGLSLSRQPRSADA